MNAVVLSQRPHQHGAAVQAGKHFAEPGDRRAAQKVGVMRRFSCEAAGVGIYQALGDHSADEHPQRAIEWRIRARYIDVRRPDQKAHRRLVCPGDFARCFRINDRRELGQIPAVKDFTALGDPFLQRRADLPRQRMIGVAIIDDDVWRLNAARLAPKGEVWRDMPPALAASAIKPQPNVRQLVDIFLHKRAGALPGNIHRQYAGSEFDSAARLEFAVALKHETLSTDPIGVLRILHVQEAI